MHVSCAASRATPAGSCASSGAGAIGGRVPPDGLIAVWQYAMFGAKRLTSQA